MCEQVLAKANNTDAAQANMVLAELISVTEKVKETSSTLLSNVKKSLDQLQKMFPAPESSEDNEFVLISRRIIRTDQDRKIWSIYGFISMRAWAKQRCKW